MKILQLDAEKQKHYILLFAMFFGVITRFRTLNTDLWFLLAHGRYVVEHGFPHVDPFSMHEGLHFIMQQWLSAVLFWELYSFGGTALLHGFTYFMGLVLIAAYYRMLLLVSSNRDLAAVLALIMGVVISIFFLTERPQIFSSLLLLGEIYVLESYARRPRGYLLPAIPVLSALLINMHAAMWLMLFVLLLPYGAEVLLKGHLSLSWLRPLETGWSFKAILFVLVLSLLAGFLNPYGPEAMTYLFHSYGNEAVNAAIDEMRAPSWATPFGKALLILYTVLLLAYARAKMPLRYVLLVAGMSLLALMHMRSGFLFFLLATMPLGYCWRGWSGLRLTLDRSPQAVRFRKLFMLVIILTALFVGIKGDASAVILMPGGTALYGGLFILFAVLSFGIAFLWKGAGERKDFSLRLLSALVGTIFLLSLSLIVGHSIEMPQAEKTLFRAEEVLRADTTPEKARLYTGYQTGDAFIFKGWKPYIDARAEVYMKSLNKKDDILFEYLFVKNGMMDYKTFLDKYHFTHLVTSGEEDTILYTYLKDDPDYELLWDSQEVQGEGLRAWNIRIYKKKSPAGIEEVPKNREAR